MNPAEVIGIEVRQYVGPEGLRTLVPRVIGQTAEAERGKGVRPICEWSWEAYEQELGISSEKLATATACFASIESALAERGLKWPPGFRKTYIGFFRPGHFLVARIDLGLRTPWVSVSLPDPPERLGLENPYPNLKQDWLPSLRNWGWTIPDAASVPDFGPAIDLSRPHQPESGPMRPPATEETATT